MMKEIKVYLDEGDYEAALALADTRRQKLSTWIRGVVGGEIKRRLDRRSLEEVVIAQLGPVIDRRAEEAVERAIKALDDTLGGFRGAIVSPYGGLAFLEDSDAIEEAQ